jgi:IS1 family transposase
LAQKKVATLPEELSDTLVEPALDDPDTTTTTTTLELDELWPFVFKKTRKRWVWLALCRATRQVVAYAIGNRRGEATCRRLWERIPEAYRGGCCYSDFWEAYRNVSSRPSSTWR